MSTVFVPTPQSILDDTLEDVFETIIPNTAYEYQQKRSELWYRFRYHGIGNPDVKYWEQCMIDRYNLIEETWDIKIKAWKQYKTSVASSVDFSASSAESKTVTEREDMPDSPAGTTIYLSDRTTIGYNGKNYEGLESATVDDYIKAVPDPWDGFTSQFRLLFCYTI